MFHTVDCYDRNIKPCFDCGYCKKTAECAIRDMDDIDEYLNKADLLIFATPLYNFSFPAPMKLILDRMQRYFSARFSLNIKPPINKKKKGVLLLTCGSEDLSGTEIMQLQLKKIFTVINCKLVGSIFFKGTDKMHEIPNDLLVKEIKDVINSL